MSTYSYDDFFHPINRPSWDEYFLNIASVVKTRSCDENTKVGTVIVDSKNRIVGTGYNSFPAGVVDSSIPNYRPKDMDDSPKYLRIIHSEINAVCNMVKHDNSKLTAYITIPPCQTCLNCLCQIGVKRIVIVDNSYIICVNQDEQYEYDNTLHDSNISLETMTQKYLYIQDFSEFQWTDK